MMKKGILLLAPVAIMLMTGCFTVTSGNVSVNNGKDSDAIVKKEIKMASFNEIEVSQGIKVIVEQGNYPGKVSVATTPSAEKYLCVKVEGETLKAYYANKAMSPEKIKGPSIISVSIPELSEADLSSGASIYLDGTFKSNKKMEFDLSSGSYLNIESLTCGCLSLDVSSGANVTVENFNGDLDADSSSGSSISVKEARGGIFTVDASSGSSISLKSNQSDEIRASASSGASVSLSGRTEKLSRHTSSGGSVKTSDLRNSR
ncbi:MAG: DUF2807 domain-containing protein [Muribaculaceae bacterium]|nr:DUF2807 domain-containing protein [Muribaculaceae bacterium]